MRKVTCASCGRPYDYDSDDFCPKCGSYMVEKPGKRGEVVHLCANETCRYKTSVSKPEEDED